jgi:hypothetical protein
MIPGKEQFYSAQHMRLRAAKNRLAKAENNFRIISELELNLINEAFESYEKDAIEINAMHDKLLNKYRQKNFLFKEMVTNLL